MLLPTNSIASPQNLELIAPVTDTEIALDLELPQEIKHVVDGQLLYSYTPDNFRLQLKIFKTYTVLAEAHILLLEDIFQLEEDSKYLISALSECNMTLHDVNSDREFIYKLRKEEKDKLNKDILKQQLKTVVIVTGSSLAGIGLGILIGVFVI